MKLCTYDEKKKKKKKKKLTAVYLNCMGNSVAITQIIKNNVCYVASTQTAVTQ